MGGKGKKEASHCLGTMQVSHTHKCPSSHLIHHWHTAKLQGMRRCVIQATLR